MREIRGGGKRGEGGSGSSGWLHQTASGRWAGCLLPWTREKSLDQRGSGKYLSTARRSPAFPRGMY